MSKITAGGLFHSLEGLLLESFKLHTVICIKIPINALPVSISVRFWVCSLSYWKIGKNTSTMQAASIYFQMNLHSQLLLVSLQLLSKWNKEKKGLLNDCSSLQVQTAFSAGYLTFTPLYKRDVSCILTSLNSLHNGKLIDFLFPLWFYFRSQPLSHDLIFLSCIIFCKATVCRSFFTTRYYWFS